MIRYPPRVAIDAILTTMMSERRADPAGSNADILHFWGFARTDSPTTHDMAHTTIVLDADAERSPILESAQWLMQRLSGRLWGFGLAYWTVGEMFTGRDGVPREAIDAAIAGQLLERAGAHEVCAATIFDARGRSYTSMTYAHLPELGQSPTGVDDTRGCVDTWIDLFDRRAATAHAWAAAITLDPDGNRATLARLRAS
ncbi:hypothetical protein [Nocardia sp. CNY236]|uniref:hypothetical protein n=1 Tax=Nocardia sp. CNY236 TaxID=1169152 RepID=UPI000409649C|nr:hypothetical protein [Nocardia sp. CNY236]